MLVTSKFILLSAPLLITAITTIKCYFLTSPSAVDKNNLCSKFIHSTILFRSTKETFASKPNTIIISITKFYWAFLSSNSPNLLLRIIVCSKQICLLGTTKFLRLCCSAIRVFFFLTCSLILFRLILSTSCVFQFFSQLNQTSLNNSFSYIKLCSLDCLI